MFNPYAFLTDTSITFAGFEERESISRRFRKSMHSRTPCLMPALIVTVPVAAPSALSMHIASPSASLRSAASSGEMIQHILRHHGAAFSVNFLVGQVVVRKEVPEDEPIGPCRGGCRCGG